jgi:hypothetical protein
MTRDHFILREDGSLESVDLLTWANWFETADRHIGNDTLSNGVRVSTVFLGIDHNFGLNGPPLLFETMIFGGPHDQWQNRYATKDEAVVGHAHALEIARSDAA